MLRLVSSPWLTVVSATIIIFVVIYVLDADEQRSALCTYRRISLYFCIYKALMMRAPSQV